MEEYKKITEKDKAMGKDFNNAAYDEMKRNRYYFEYLRTQEKLYLYDKQKNTKLEVENAVQQHEEVRDKSIYKTEAQDRMKRILDAAENTKSNKLIK